MKTKSIIWIVISTLAVGIFAGYLIFGGSAAEQAPEEMKHDHEHDKTVAAEESSVWTCSMHPQVKQPEPGDCPICGMDLIPLEKSENDDDPAVLKMTENAVELANIQTSTVDYEVPRKEIFLNGKIMIDERLMNNQIAHIDGRIENLYINFEGQRVKKGQKLGLIYSPELISAQRELLEAAKYEKSIPKLYRAAVEKLKAWKIPESEIEKIAETGEIRRNFSIYADFTGYVIELKASEGEQVGRGEILFKIARLDNLWIEFDVYENDLQWVNESDIVSFNVPSMPGKEFNAKITYVDPVINPKTRIAKARAEIRQSTDLLKPHMFVRGEIQSRIPGGEEMLSVPRSAVMWTGPRSVVYVKVEEAESPTFEMREVTIGEEFGDRYVIEDGLTAGDEIVTQGTFNLDAAAQLNNKYSMMNRQVEVKDQEDKFATPEYSDVNAKFKKQLQNVVQKYLELSSALVKTDYETADKKADMLLKMLKDVDVSLLENNQVDFWVKQHKSIRMEATDMSKAENIDQQRGAFIKLSQAMIKSVKAFGAGMDIFVQFCPMANDDRGAYWLATQQEILNPYFGDMMLHCGEITEKIASK